MYELDVLLPFNVGDQADVCNFFLPSPCGEEDKIAGFQYDQMTRRIADLLKAPNV